MKKYMCELAAAVVEQKKGAERETERAKEQTEKKSSHREKFRMRINYTCISESVEKVFHS